MVFDFLYNLYHLCLLNHHYNKLVEFPHGGIRSWHFNKCPENSYWNYKLYKGPYTTWVDGGCGYLLSKKSMNLITEYYDSNQDDIFKNHIYEDLMIALILFHHNILGTKIEKIIFSPKGENLIFYRKNFIMFVRLVK